MVKTTRAGMVFIRWIGDHPPRHVHVYRNGRLILKFNQESRVAMTGRLTTKLLGIIEELESKGRL